MYPIMNLLEPHPTGKTQFLGIEEAFKVKSLAENTALDLAKMYLPATSISGEVIEKSRRILLVGNFLRISTISPIEYFLL